MANLTEQTGDQRLTTPFYIGEYLYKSTSTITSINNCVIDSNNYSMPGQSGSPLFLPGGYAIGITSATTGEHSMRSVQLDNGITTWLNQNGYFD